MEKSGAAATIAEGLLSLAGNSPLFNTRSDLPGDDVLHGIDHEQCGRRIDVFDQHQGG